jgi:methylenetetrahydrofolate reductase (NADPH)
MQPEQDVTEMRIDTIYQNKKTVLSFEVFPPKKDTDIEAIYRAVSELAGLQPDYMSVTYGAGGGGAVNRTGEIASHIKNGCGSLPLAHLTCTGSSREDIRRIAGELAGRGVENILALRGDPRPGQKEGDYPYASDLIRELKSAGDFCVGAACYPEGHIDAESFDADLARLREKQEAGADFLITQLFFDNDLFWRFLDKARAAGVTLPVSAGVMPILSRGQVERMIFLCGASLPSPVIRLLHRYENNPADLRKAGIEFAVAQMEALAAGGVDGIHIYTMNHPDIAATAAARVRAAL